MQTTCRPLRLLTQKKTTPDDALKGEKKSNNIVDWEAVKCYSVGKNVRPLLCHHSGCTKFAHQYCQDQWGKLHSLALYIVSYSLCKEHHPQYCRRFIEEMNDDVADNNEKNGEANCNASGETHNSSSVGNELDDNVNGNSKSEGEEKVEDEDDKEVYCDYYGPR